jgi:hypothetical protein
MELFWTFILYTNKENWEIYSINYHDFSIDLHDFVIKNIICDFCPGMAGLYFLSLFLLSL